MMKTGLPTLRAAAWAAIALTGTLLAACDGIGEGTSPSYVTISLNGTEDQYDTYECAAFQLAGTAYFKGENKSSGDITTRSEWRSSNPGVIDVSNGEIETGYGSVFPAGTVIVRSPGTAVIRLDYVGLSDEFSVSAAPIQDVRIEPELTRLVPESTQAFTLEVTFEEDELSYDLTDSAVWSIPTSGAPASLSGSTVTTVSDPLDRPFLLDAQLYTCDRKASREMQLGAVSELRLTYEQDEALPLPLGISDEIRVEAVFEDSSAEVQNLSDQVEIEQLIGDDDEASVSVGEYLTVSGAVADTPVQYSVEYDPLDITVETRSYTFTDIEMVSLRVDPARAELYFPETLELQAYGLFEDGYERPVRRDVSWETLNDDLATVVSGGADAGEVTPTELEGEATIRASTSNSEGILEADADLMINLE